MAEIKGCNSCIYQSTKNPPIDGVYFYPPTKASSSQQGKNGKGQNVFGLLLAALRGGVKEQCKIRTYENVDMCDNSCKYCVQYKSYIPLFPPY